MSRFLRLTGILKSLGGSQSRARRQVASRSGHFEGGAFQNSTPTHIVEPGSMLKTIRCQLFGKEQRVPARSIPTVSGHRGVFANVGLDTVTAMWIGHASVLVHLDGSWILTDPIWSLRASPSQWIGPKRFFPPPTSIDELPELAAVLVSHDHYDHLDMNTIVALSKRNTPFVVPLGVGAHLEAWKVPARNIIELNWNDSCRIADLDITVTPARHYSGRYLLDNNRTLWGSFAVAGPHHRVFYSGDSGYFPGFKTIGESHGPFDMTLMKVGACGPTWPDIHMSPEQAVQAHQDVRGEMMLPVHWGTFNLAFHSWNDPAIRALQAARTAGVRITIPKPGALVNTTSPAHLDEWWA